MLPARRVLLLAVLAVLAAAGCCASTRPFVDEAGRVALGSVASMERVVLGGVEQAAWFRGRDASRTPLILLSGGPGASEAALFRSFGPELEESFPGRVPGAARRRALLPPRPRPRR